jgi:hypothetical protein
MVPRQVASGQGFEDVVRSGVVAPHQYQQFRFMPIQLAFLHQYHALFEVAVGAVAAELFVGSKFRAGLVEPTQPPGDPGRQQVRIGPDGPGKAGQLQSPPGALEFMGVCVLPGQGRLKGGPAPGRENAQPDQEESDPEQPPTSNGEHFGEVSLLSWRDRSRRTPAGLPGR